MSAIYNKPERVSSETGYSLSYDILKQQLGHTALNLGSPAPAPSLRGGVVIPVDLQDVVVANITPRNLSAAKAFYGVSAKDLRGGFLNTDSILTENQISAYISRYSTTNASCFVPFGGWVRVGTAYYRANLINTTLKGVTIGGVSPTGSTRAIKVAADLAVGKVFKQPVPVKGYLVFRVVSNALIAGNKRYSYQLLGY